MFFLENHTQNVMEKVVPESFFKSQIDNLKFYTACFYCMPKSRTTKIY